MLFKNLISKNLKNVSKQSTYLFANQSNRAVSSSSELTNILFDDKTG